MSMTSAIPKVRLEDPSRLKHAQALAESEEGLRSGVPSIASLRRFASKFRSSPRDRRDQKLNGLVTSIPHDGSKGPPSISRQRPHAVAEEPREPQRVQRESHLQLALSRPTLDRTTRNTQDDNHTSLFSGSVASPSATYVALKKVRSREPELLSKSTGPLDVPLPPDSSITGAGLGTSEGVYSSNTEGNDPQPPIIIDTEGRNDSETGHNVPSQHGVSDAAQSSAMSQSASAVLTGSSNITPNTFTKGKEPMHEGQSKTLSVHVPGSRFDRLLPVRMATSEDHKAHRVETRDSPADRERLKNFSEILKSKRNRIDLFGKEMPLSMFSLVQVTEGNSSPKDYICIHGLRTQADITRFHLVMSRDRYRPLYQPLKLCYDTAKFTRVGLTEPDVGGSTSHDITSLQRGVALSESELTTMPGLLVESTESKLGNKLLYRPVLHNETYCGALCQTLVDGKPWISTLGGVIEIGDSRYIMACEHAPSTFSEPSINDPSSADILLEEDYQRTILSKTGIEGNIEEPLVFATDGFYEELNVPQRAEVYDALPSIDGEWKDLMLDGVVTVGPEWSLLPIPGHALLPNFIEESTEIAGNARELKRHFLDQVCEPQGGHTARIVTHVEPQPSGRVLADSSFIVAGGTDELIPVWTVLLDNDQSVQTGDSGSWVIDTSDPMHYKVIGTTIATTEGEAHFVRIVDQFYEMEKSLGITKSVDLVPAFRALIHCANLAFLNNDAKSDYLIDEALSPYTLEQLHIGWFLRGLKTFLANNGGNEQHGEAREKYSSRDHRPALKDLLLRYGCELLDSLVDFSDFKKQHAVELSISDRQTLEALEKALLQARTNELKRLRRPTAVMAQSHNYTTQAPPSYFEIQNNPAMPGPRQTLFEGTKYHIPKRRVYLEFKKGAPLLVLLGLPILAEGVASVSGVAAAAVTYLVQFRGNEQFADMSITQYLALGAVVGPISTTVTIVQVLLTIFSRHCHGEGWTRILFLVALSLVSAIARTMLPALYVTRQRGLQDNGTTFVAAAVAAVPSLLPTTSPTISNILDTFGGKGRMQVIFWFSVIGFDVLAGYTFGGINQNLGHSTPNPSSAAAGTAVLSTLTTALVLVPLRYLYMA